MIQHLPVAAGARDRQPRLAGDIREPEPAFVRKRVIAPDRKHVGVAPQRLEIQVGIGRTRKADREIGLAGDHRSRDLIHALVDHANAHVRHLRAERLDGLRHEGDCRRGRARHSDAARMPSRNLVDTQHGGFEIVERGARSFEEGFAHAREPHVARAAREKARAQQVLELLDAAAERGRGQVQVVSSRAEAALVRHRHECLQLLQVEIDA
jgi:hypothetical protein